MESARFLPVTLEDLATALLEFVRNNLENFYVHHQHTHAFMHFPISGHMQFTLTSNDQPASNHHRRVKSQLRQTGQYGIFIYVYCF